MSSLSRTNQMVGYLSRLYNGVGPPVRSAEPGELKEETNFVDQDENAQWMPVGRMVTELII